MYSFSPSSRAACLHTQHQTVKELESLTSVASLTNLHSDFELSKKYTQSVSTEIAEAETGINLTTMCSSQQNFGLRQALRKAKKRVLLQKPICQEGVKFSKGIY